MSTDKKKLPTVEERKKLLAKRGQVRTTATAEKRETAVSGAATRERRG